MRPATNFLSQITLPQWMLIWLLIVAAFLVIWGILTLGDPPKEKPRRPLPFPRGGPPPPLAEEVRDKDAPYFGAHRPADWNIGSETTSLRPRDPDEEGDLPPSWYVPRG